jgi:hypothetical protein
MRSKVFSDELKHLEAYEVVSSFSHAFLGAERFVMSNDLQSDPERVLNSTEWRLLQNAAQNVAHLSAVQ